MPRVGAKAIGRPRISPETETAIREGLAAGKGILKVAREVGAGVGTVQRVRAEMLASATMAVAA